MISKVWLPKWKNKEYIEEDSFKAVEFCCWYYGNKVSYYALPVTKRVGEDIFRLFILYGEEEYLDKVEGMLEEQLGL